MNAGGRPIILSPIFAVLRSFFLLPPSILLMFVSSFCIVARIELPDCVWLLYPVCCRLCWRVY